MTDATDDNNALRPFPRENPDLIGHEAAERAMLGAWTSGRLPHAWLIAGPRGVGKATLAYRFARFVLAGGGDGGLFGDGPDTLYTDPESGTFRRVASGGHADFLSVERGVADRSGRLRSEIVVDDARAVAKFLHLTPAEGGWRVVVVDSADEMNRNAANAVLKIVEEPPPRALVLLVSHAPARLLPTLRSRCRKLPLMPLSEAQVSGILASRRPDLGEGERLALARISEGSAGRALALAESGGLALYDEMMGLLSTLPSLDVPALHAFGDKLARRDAEVAYRVVTELLEWWLARMVRAGAGQGVDEMLPGDGSAELVARLAPARQLDRWAELWENTSALFRRAESARLDRKQVMLNAFLALESTARA